MSFGIGPLSHMGRYLAEEPAPSPFFSHIALSLSGFLLASFYTWALGSHLVALIWPFHK